MGRRKVINRRLIRRSWRKLHLAESLALCFNEAVSLNRRKMKCLKDSYKSSIWKLELKLEASQRRFPIILKISKQLRKKRPESIIEKKIARKARKVLQPFMPKIYLTKKNVNGHDLWVFMEYIEAIQGRVRYQPDHFAKIIPVLAKLHAATMNERFFQHERIFAGWLPRFDSAEMKRERIRLNKKTVHYLNKAMKISSLRSLLQPYDALLRRLLAKGPEYFPEVSREGLSIIHGDLNTANIVCHNVKKKKWEVKFIDWEGAKFAPCWFDLVNLIGIFLAYRREWADQEEEITRRSVKLYADEMKTHGVVFHTDPQKLYQMAYLKRILERSLYLQLNWAVTGKKEAKLLPVLLEKIKTLGKKLDLY